jgi:DNA helicase-2/ATP-dependent DNA helicase PcrA
MNGSEPLATPLIARLDGEARQAVEYRGGHLQIIASAGSGKTEVVSQRIAALLAEGVEPKGVVAFTFTERAATSLKSRVERCVLAHQDLGRPFLDRLGGMFIGTIHSYCFDLLQRHVSKYETYDVLDENRLAAFLAREAHRIDLKALDGTLFKSMRTFLANLDVIENELLQPADLEDPFLSIYESYLAALEANRFLTYGQLIAHAVAELDRPAVLESVRASLRHLIVDEYQDVNPAQEALVGRLAADPVQLCVVGDDDQSIYQWRGSTVENIVSFADRYPNVKQFTIEQNRRSRPEIIRHANLLAELIEARLPKTMQVDRATAGEAEVVNWMQETPQDEARVIAEAIKQAVDERGYRYRDVAILCRGRISIPPILDALRALDIPVQPGGRTNLFLQPEADLFGRTICWLIDRDWRPGAYDPSEEVTLDDLVVRYTSLFALDDPRVGAVRVRLVEWKEAVAAADVPANLIREFYDLLGDLGIDQWDLGDGWVVSRLGTLARCSQVLVDYEAARRRSRPDRDRPGEQKGATDRGKWYYAGLATYVQNWAQGAYEGFEGEDALELDAVDLTTIHQSKGLEWPLVFVPALTSSRFPTKNTGKPRDWRIPTELFNPGRYEGSENDERRLFYVAMTRARDYLSLSTFERMKNRMAPSPFLIETVGDVIPSLAALPLPAPAEHSDAADEILEITFSDLAAYRNCGFQYRMRTLIGFQPPLVPELGYGKAVHHVLREVAQHVQRHGTTPSPEQLERLFDDGFYLPAANKPAHREMKASARQLVDRYVAEWGDDLHQVWAVERPFELHLGGATVIGRADVIIDEAGGEERLTIVDYKTAADAHEQHAFQLQVYTDAGRREGLVVDRAFVHDLRSATRIPVSVDHDDVESAENLVTDLVSGLKARAYDAQPEKERCSYCDISALCRNRAA